MSESWEQTNINAKALVAYTVGVATIAVSVISIQWWVDERIAARVVPIEVELKEFKQEVRSALQSSDYSRNRQYGELISKFDQLLESRR